MQIENYSIIILTITILAATPLRQLYFSVPKIKITETQEKKRIPFFDIAKGIAILAVVVIHIIWLFIINKEILEYHRILFHINNFLRFCIPFFFIISGILLPNKIPSLKNYFSKKITRLLIPYTLCVLFLGIFHAQGTLEIFQNFFTGKAAVPYYFMVVLFQMYLLYPILLKFRTSKFFLPIMFFISLGSYLFPQTWKLFEIPLVLRYLFFFAYGMNKREYFLYAKAKISDTFLWLLIFIASSALFFIFESYYFNVRLFFGISAFHLFFALKPFLEKRKCYFLGYLGENSLFIFLVHYGIQVLLFQIPNLSTLTKILLSFILSIFFSLIFAALYKKVQKIFFTFLH